MQYIIIFVEVFILVGMSAIYSGLNIALMSLSRTDLRRKKKLGNKEAIKVLPFRENSHLSLSAILFANVAIVSANALILEHHFNGLIAGLVSTLLIVVFGEVLPQAIFVKRALWFTALLSPMLRLTVWITYPVAKPLQLILDKLVGDEKHSLHSRDELGLIIGEHQTDGSSELDEDEVEIIQSALQLSEKTVRDIMRPIDEVFWLPIDAELNEETVDMITSHGYSRIPILSRDKSDCYGVLLMKDMVDINFTGHPVSVSAFTLHKTRVIGSRTALDTMFRKFISIHSHLVPIEKDDEIIGIVTVEDLVEEILGHEIADETDHAHNRE
jgi:metal transporter CNNM